VLVFTELPQRETNSNIKIVRIEVGGKTSMNKKSCSSILLLMKIMLMGWAKKF